MFTDRDSIKPLISPPQPAKQDSSQEIKSPKSPETKKTDKFRFLTFNLPCFPAPLAHINKNVLPADEKTRAAAFIQKIKELKKEDQYDVICLQEIWSPEIADYIQKELYEFFPHQIRGVNGDSKICVNGGLMLLSSRPILESKSMSFPNSNNMVGDEKLAGKGFIAAKIADGEDGFHTVITTHLHSGDALWKGFSEWFGGTSSYRRSVEMGIIHNETDAWAKQPPKGQENLKAKHTIFMGDLNTSVDCKVIDEEKNIVDDHKLLGISVGSALNGFEAGHVKYPRQRELLQKYEPPVPKNYISPRVDKPPFDRGKGKAVSPELVHEAKKKNLFTGTVCDGKLGHQDPTHIIDLMAIRKDGPEMGKFTTKIVSFDEEEKKVKVSDHFAVAGELDTSEPCIHRTGLYQHLEPKLVPNAVNYSVGAWNRFFKHDTELYEVKLAEVKLAAVEKRPMLAG